LDDLDLYLLASQIHKKHKQTDEILSLIWSKVAKVLEEFSIDEKLNIEIPSTKKFKKLNIPEEKYREILSAGLTHEDGHAFLFPFMKYVNNVYAIAKKYSDYAGIPFDANIFSNVENIISDITNEIIILSNKLPGYEDLPTLTYYYIYLPNIDMFKKFEKAREEIEKNPLMALWLKHRETLAKHTPQQEKYFSDILYNALTSIYANFNIKRWITQSEDTFSYLGFTQIFDTANELYNIIKDKTAKTTEELLQHMLDTHNINAIAPYLTLVLAMYRITIENNTQEALKTIPTDNIKKPEPPSPDELDKIFKYMTRREFLDPRILEEIAKRILHQALLTKNGTWASYETSDEIIVPWYRHPRGKIMKSTITKNILEWKVRKTITTIGDKKETTSATPSNITILIDESGSTSAFKDILSPITNMIITIFDIERAITMAILINTMNEGGENTPVNLVRFSTNTITEKHTVKSAYERIKNNTEPMMEETDIISAVKTAVEMHKDANENYFILLTDMNIDDLQAKYITEKLKSIKKSPLMLLIVGEELPEELNTLKRRNTAIINIKDYKDFKKIEDAIRTLLNT